MYLTLNILYGVDLEDMGPMIQKFVIGQEVGDGSSSVCIRPWRLEGADRFESIENLHGILHDDK